jgi:hypothetical protein
VTDHLVRELRFSGTYRGATSEADALHLLDMLGVEEVECEE